MSYDKLSDVEKKNILVNLYIDQNKSFADIAHEHNTYANKVRRDAIRLNIKIRSKSEAQKNALQTGKHKHPTKGTNRCDEVKKKIGSSVLESWAEISDKELENRKKQARDKWEQKSEDEKKHILSLANAAVRQSSKTGSKLEKFILSKLLADGFKVDFHKEHTLSNTKLQIDLFIPSINTAIEIDGPSHFLPVWGDDALSKNKKYDNKKHGLILGKGWKLIRIKQKKDFSKARGELIYTKLKQMIVSDDLSGSTTNSFTIED